MSLTIHIDTRGLVPWRQQVYDGVKRACIMAGRDAIRAMRTEASRQVRSRKGMKASSVGKALSIIWPSGKDIMFWRLRASGTAMPVAAYPHRQTKKGVTVQINKGARSLIRGAFIATMKSGHTGVFVRHGEKTMPPVQSYRGHKKYAGKRRQPIKELWTTRVSEAFTDSMAAIGDKGKAVFKATFTRVLPMEAAKARRRR